jgi:DNA-binding SARP family transcriptional activator
MSEVLHVQLLGEFGVSHGDTLVETLGSPRLQSLLAFLLLHRDVPQPRQHLAFTFWPDSTEAQALGNLRSSILRLRRALPDVDRFLQIDAQSVRWQPDAPFTFDVADLEAALAQAGEATQVGDLAAAREAMDTAVDLYQGDLLPSCYDDWILPHRDRIRQALLEALEDLIPHLEQGRAYRQAITYAQHLLRLDPLHEATYRSLMCLHALNGDRAGALRAYHT